MDTAQIEIPLSVPKDKQKDFIERIFKITNGNKKVLLFAGDQRIEHTNSSFLGPNISIDDLSPKHFFNIASLSKCNLLATQFGLVDKYAKDFKKINYIIKLNSITKFLKEGPGYKESKSLISIEKSVSILKENNVNLLGFGFTLFIGIEDEPKMLQKASNIILKAHSFGFPVILWCYPKGKNIKDETDPNVINTAVSVASCIGADFVKINSPQKKGVEKLELIKNAVIAAGKTKILISGGEQIDSFSFVKEAYNICNYTDIGGIAVGRNIHQKPLHEAVRFCNALYKVVVDKEPLDQIIDDFKNNLPVSSIL